MNYNNIWKCKCFARFAVLCTQASMSTKKAPTALAMGSSHENTLNGRTWSSQHFCSAAPRWWDLAVPSNIKNVWHIPQYLLDFKLLNSSWRFWGEPEGDKRKTVVSMIFFLFVRERFQGESDRTRRNCERWLLEKINCLVSQRTLREP